MRKSVRLFVILCALSACALASTDKNSLACGEDTAGDGAHESAVHPLFNFSDTTCSAFPSDRFTVFDLTQNTGLRVNLPKPSSDECNTTQSSACIETDLLNELDGFNIRPRFSIPFSGPIDRESINKEKIKEKIFLVSLGDSLVNGQPPDYKTIAESDVDELQLPPDAGAIINVTQAMWDPLTNTLHVEADGFLDQHTRYVLVVTRGVLDATGQPIEQAETFNRLRSDDDNGSDPAVRAYSQALKLGLAAALQFKGVHREDIAVASVFSTLSSTSVLEKVHAHLMSLPAPQPANFHLGPPGADNQPTPSIFKLCTATDEASITNFTFNQHTRHNLITGADTIQQVSLTGGTNPRLPLLGTCGRDAAISKIAYGKYSSPNYLGPDAMMEPVATFSGTPVLQPICPTCTETSNQIYFNVFVPSGTPPAAGWPVVIYGNGSADNMNGGVFNVAATFARYGFATVGLNLVGQGFGPKSTITVTVSDSDQCQLISKVAPCTISVALPGRTYDIDNANISGTPDGIYTADEGGNPAGPRRILFGREGNRQNVADVAQLLRVLEAGVDLDGTRLDATHVYLTGISSGAALGLLTAAVEPRIQSTGVASLGGWNEVWLAPANRSGVGIFLAARKPALLTSATGPLTAIGGPSLDCSICGPASVGTPFFNENVPAPRSDVLDNQVDGALEIQEFFERIEWLTSASAPGSLAPYIRRKPLVPARAFMILMSRGDQSVTNAQTSEAVRNGALEDRVSRYRHDVFWAGLTSAQQSKALKNPHTTLLRNDSLAPAMQGVAHMAQEEIARFFLYHYVNGPAMPPDNSDIVVPAGGESLFEVPAQALFSCGSVQQLTSCDFGFIP
jgi:pimeloyl-ACP methyl ester carboxylesterase